ncbi:MAG: hypothetical protein R2745_09260 [Vicinamibacterales bacterium]
MTAGASARAAVAAASFSMAVALAAGPAGGALETDIGLEAIDHAIAFAQQAERAERQAFHDGYDRFPGDAVRRVSLVSEYRRVVLLVEEKRRLLDRGYGRRQMIDALRPWRGLLEVIVELQFHPQNTYIGVPPVDVLIVPLDAPGSPTPHVAESTDRRPHFGAYWDPTPMDAPWWPFPPPTAPVLNGTEPLTGGWVHARFDAHALGGGRHEVVIRDGTATLGRASFDFDAVR